MCLSVVCSILNYFCISFYYLQTVCFQEGSEPLYIHRYGVLNKYFCFPKPQFSLYWDIFRYLRQLSYT